MKILIVDDDYSRRRVYVKYLKSNGNVVIEAAGAEQGKLAFAANKDVEFILIDLYDKKGIPDLIMSIKHDAVEKDTVEKEKIKIWVVGESEQLICRDKLAKV